MHHEEDISAVTLGGIFLMLLLCLLGLLGVIQAQGEWTRDLGHVRTVFSDEFLVSAPKI